MFNNIFSMEVGHAGRYWTMYITLQKESIPVWVKEQGCLWLVPIIDNYRQLWMELNISTYFYMYNHKADHRAVYRFYANLAMFSKVKSLQFGGAVFVSCVCIKNFITWECVHLKRWVNAWLNTSVERSASVLKGSFCLLALSLIWTRDTEIYNKERVCGGWLPCLGAV